MSLLKEKNGQMSFLDMIVSEDQLAEDPNYVQIITAKQILKTRSCLKCSKKHQSSEYWICRNCRRQKDAADWEEDYSVAI